MNNLPITGNQKEIQQKNASKAAPSNKQKRQHVAIVARVPDIIFSVFFSIRLFVSKHVSSHDFHHCHHVPSNCFPALHRKHQEVSNFLHFSKMPLQSTCFQIQFYLCAVLSSSQSRTPLSISRHFAIGRKFLLKASFYTLFSVLHYLSSIPLSQKASACFHISPSYCLFFIQRKKSIFEFKLTCN